MSALRKELHSGPVFIIGPPFQCQGLQKVVEQVLEWVVDIISVLFTVAVVVVVVPVVVVVVPFLSLA